jgi:hypothetical protein
MERMAAQQRRDQGVEEKKEEAKEGDESSEVSSCWEDWQDPEYIEEQRMALREFEATQKEIRNQHQGKRKKKKKKKKGGLNAGAALGLDEDEESVSQYPAGTLDMNSDG